MVCNDRPWLHAFVVIQLYIVGGNRVTHSAVVIHIKLICGCLFVERKDNTDLANEHPK